MIGRRQRTSNPLHWRRESFLSVTEWRADHAIRCHYGVSTGIGGCFHFSGYIACSARYRRLSNGSKDALMLRRAHVYLGTTVKEAIVAALHYNSAGIFFEQDEPVVVADWRRSPGLAIALRSALDRFAPQERNLRDYKRTEWPSYRASNSRSVREFEATHICINVQASNKAEFFYDADVYPPGEEDISLHVMLNRHGSDEEIDRKLLKLFNACVEWPRS
jgi:hypothetical protein